MATLVEFGNHHGEANALTIEGGKTIVRRRDLPFEFIVSISNNHLKEFIYFKILSISKQPFYFKQTFNFKTTKYFQHNHFISTRLLFCKLMIVHL
jgi:hypothetical protein